MMIKKFTHIKARTYKNFSWPSSLQQFGRYNLIYGWNGSGKTTLADILQSIEKKELNEEEGISNFSLNYGGTEIKPLNLTSHASLPVIRVFNRNFREKNIFNPEGAKPIFFIGEDNIKKYEELELLGKKVKDNNYAFTVKEKEIKNKEDELKKLLQEKSKQIREELSITNPKHYDRNSFENDCKKFGNQAPNSKSTIEHHSEFSTLRENLYADIRDPIQTVEDAFRDLNKLQEEVVELLKKTVISHMIEKLGENSKIANWVKNGLEIHQEYKFNDCQFCQHKLPVNWLTVLEGHFNDEYKSLELRLTRKAEDIKREIDSLQGIKTPDPASFYREFQEEYQCVQKNFNDQIKTCCVFLSSLLKAIAAKKENLFSSFSFDTQVVDDVTPNLTTLNTIIESHNAITMNFKNRKKQAADSIKDLIVSQSFLDYQNLTDAINKLDKERTTLENSIEDAKDKITALEKTILEHKKPVEELNKDLEDYLGHPELQFVTSDNDLGYTLLRHEQPATALSEGEKTAISLLYFLKTLEDKNFNLKEGIVVIDDPVCSLDETAFFYALSYIKDRTQDAKQLFILTHNFLFFTEVKKWFQSLDEKGTYFQTICVKRESRIEKIHTTLEKHKSEYHYLFYLIVEGAKNTSEDWGEYYSLPNVARRFLESFISFRYPGKTIDNTFKEKEFTKYTPAKKHAILRFLHLHSHRDENLIDLPLHNPALLSQAPQILSDILDFVKIADSDHYKDMMSILIEAKSAAK